MSSKLNNEPILPGEGASTYAIMHAKKKPAGVSDVRWRIELRRRKNRARYDCVPPGGYYQKTTFNKNEKGDD